VVFKIHQKIAAGVFCLSAHDRRDPKPSNLNRDPKPSNLNRDPKPSNLNRDPKPSNLNRDPKIEKHAQSLHYDPGWLATFSIPKP
jgi:hypothetical protein